MGKGFSIYTKTTAKTNGFGNPIDWNGEFQRILELPEITEDQKLNKYNKLSSLSKDFVAIAKRIGKVRGISDINRNNDWI